MSVVTCVHGTAAEVNVMRVYLISTDTVQEGYPVCFNFDAADVTSENKTQTSPDVGEEFFNDARRIQVEKPSESNKLHFAGVVSQKSHGVTGPNWIEIHRPGSICNVYAASDVDSESSSALNSGETVTFAPGTYTFLTGGFCGTGSAMVLQDIDRSSVNGLVMVELMGGIPSGGVTPVTLISASGAFSVVLGSEPVFAGVYQLNDNVLGSSNPITSVLLLAADGDYIGQRFQFQLLTTAISCVVSFGISSSFKQMTCVDVAGFTSGTANLSWVDTGSGNASSNAFEMMWNGKHWIFVYGQDVRGFVS